MAGRAAEGAAGGFRPIGCNGFHRRGGERAQFDQQPIEAHATVAACLEAYHATEDPPGSARPGWPSSGSWGATTWGWTSTTPSTGGCCDGLQEDRVNLNQGAESTLSFLLSLGEMKLLESTPAALRRPVTESDRRQSESIPRLVRRSRPMILLTPRSGADSMEATGTTSTIEPEAMTVDARPLRPTDGAAAPRRGPRRTRGRRGCGAPGSS